MKIVESKEYSKEYSFHIQKNNYNDMMLTLNSLFYPAHNVNIPQNIMAYAISLYNFDDQLNKNIID